MPRLTYLTQNEVDAWSTVPGDKDCDELLQELNAVSGRRWVVGVREYIERGGLFRHAQPRKAYTLYLDCHGEWQVMNLVHPDGGSNFHGSRESREHVMNYMLGFIAGARTE